MEASPKCERCGSDRVVPILYGLPTGDMFEASERGEIGIGGCVVTGEDPEWLCRACDNRFGAGKPDVSGLAAVFFPKTRSERLPAPAPLTNGTKGTESDVSTQDEGKDFANKGENAEER